MSSIKNLKRFIINFTSSLNFSRRLEHKFISKNACFRPGEKICDIACGWGAYSREIVKKGGSVYGLDLSFNSMRIADSLKGRRGCYYITCDALSLAYKPYTFDKVISICSLEHFKDDERAISEMARVLKKDGELLLTVDSLTCQGISDGFREEHRKRCDVVNYYSKEFLEKKLVRGGFQLIKYKYILNSKLSGLFIKIGFRNNYGYLYHLLFPIAYPLALLSDRFFGAKEEGYKLCVKARKL